MVPSPLKFSKRVPTGALWARRIQKGTRGISTELTPKGQRKRDAGREGRGKGVEGAQHAANTVSTERNWGQLWREDCAPQRLPFTEHCLYLGTALSV